MKRILKIISFFCIITIIQCGSCLLSHAEISSDNTYNKIQLQQEKKIEIFIKNIPVYGVSIKTDNAIKYKDIQQKIESSIDNQTAVSKIKKEIGTSKVEIKKLNDREKKSLIKQTWAINELSGLMKKSTFVDYEYIILYNDNYNWNLLGTTSTVFSKSISYTSSSLSSGNSNDPKYWENNLSTYGTYDGYKYLVSGSSTKWTSKKFNFIKNHRNISWTSLIAQSLKFSAEQIYGGTVLAIADYIKVPFSIISSSATRPLNVKLDTGNGELLIWTSGHLYHRTIYIRDKKNYIKGYAYYAFGSAERYVGSIFMEYDYPIKKNKDGSYEYKSDVTKLYNQSLTNSGYYNNTSFKKKVLQKYLNVKKVYSTYDQQINLNKLRYELIK